MVDRFQAAALATRLKIPLLYGVDSVHGHGNLLGATVFPHNIGLGATRDPGLVREIARITAEETRATGPQWTFSPCVCAARDDRWGRTYESFSESSRLVERYETAIDGYQEGGVLATAKHYAGDGDTEYGTAHGRLQGRPGHRDHEPPRLLGALAAPVRAGRSRSTGSRPSCRRSRASTGPRTASATR